MKKAWIGVLAVVLGLAMALPAAAIDWSAKGFIVNVGALYKNVGSSALQSWTDWTGGYVRTRGRLFITARASENLYGVFGFEIDASRWGRTGKDPNAPGGDAGAWGADQTAVEVKHMYVDFKIPGIDVPVWMRLGVQPFAVRPVVFLSRDGSGVLIRSKVEGVTLQGFFGMIKDEQTNGNDFEDKDSAEIYGVYGDVKIPNTDLKAGAYVVWADVRGGALNLTHYDNGSYWWIGGFTQGKVGPVKAEFDVFYNGGTIDAESGTTAKDKDIDAWVVRGVLTYPYDKFNLGVGGYYATGDDESTNDLENAQYPGSTEGYPSKDLLVIYGNWMGATYALGPTFIGPRAEECGIWYARGFVFYQALDWLNLGFQVAYIGDTVEDGDNWGTDASDDDDIGWEFDVGAKVKVYKNLTWTTAFGYLVAGDALDQAGGDPEDPWLVVSSLAYTF